MRMGWCLQKMLHWADTGGIAMHATLHACGQLSSLQFEHDMTDSAQTDCTSC